MKKESELRERGADPASRNDRKTQVRTSSGYSGPLTLRKAAEGLTIERYFTRPGVDPFDEVEWEIRAAVIASEKGEIVFEQKDVEVPKFWSQTATNVVASKYFRGTLGTPERERSVRQLIGRVVRTIGAWGRGQGYFNAEADAQTFEAELKHLLVPVSHPLGEGAPGRRRHRLRAGVVHEGVRRLRRRHQERRQDPPRRQDGDPQHRSPRHRRVHQVQAGGGEEGVGAD